MLSNKSFIWKNRKLYGESAHCIWDQHQNYIQGDRSDGRTAKLTKIELDDIKDYIKQFQADPTYPTYPTYADISYYIQQKFSKYINDETLRHYFYRELSDDFKPVEEAQSKDVNCLNVSIKDIEFTILKAQQSMQLHHVKQRLFIIQLDEAVNELR